MTAYHINDLNPDFFSDTMPPPFNGTDMHSTQARLKAERVQQHIMCHVQRINACPLVHRFNHGQPHTVLGRPAGLHFVSDL